MGNILGKLLPLERILAIAMKLGILREPLKAAALGYKKLEGVRSEIKIAGSIAIYLMALSGAISWEQANTYAAPLLGAAVPSLFAKIERILPAVEKIHKEIVDASAEQSKS